MSLRTSQSIMEEGGRRPQRSTRFTGDFQKFADHDSDGDPGEIPEDDAPKKQKTPRTSSTKQVKRMKQCPGCGASVAVSLRECPHCDNQFSSKSVLISQQTALEESDNIRSRFPFEPDREEDGSLMIQSIIGRRIRKSGRRWNKPTELALMSAIDAKYDYDYLIKFKSMSYKRTQWLAAAEIESMGPKSVQHLTRYLQKIDRGDPTVQEDGEIDPSYLEVDRVLDCREEEVMEVVDELPPPQDESLNAPTSRLAAAIQESNKEEDEVNTVKASQSQDNHHVNKDAASSTVMSTRANTAGEAAATAAAFDGEDMGEEVVKSNTQIFQGEERCRRLLERVMEDSFAISFLEPVDTTVFDDYLDVVGESVCLQDIKRKLDAGEYSKYGTYSKFANDVRVIWRNCKLYNIYKSQIWHCAQYMSMLFDRLYRAWVLSYMNGAVPMSDPVGRPWEGTCRVCQIEKDDDKVMLCDHCDASYHIYCLRPPLKSIPEGTWMCDHCSNWISRTGGKILSAAAEDEARAHAESAISRKYIRVKKKKFLVKWRGLSYRDCTWETAEDVNDDEKIAEFHRVNESLPDEPPLSQAEIAMELDKNKKFQLLPATTAPNTAIDVYSTVVAQIRSFHFLKWNKPATEALLKESGPATFGLAYGNHMPMIVPSNVKALIESSTSAVVKEELDDMEIDPPHREEVKEEEEEVKDETAATATDGAVGPSPATKARQSKSELSAKGQDWLQPTPRDEVLEEVSGVLSAIVYSVARGDFLPPRPELPGNHIEVRVVIPQSCPELLMNVGEYNGRCIVAGFKRRADGTAGPVEKTGRVKLGDVLVAINGGYVGDKKFKDTADILKKSSHNTVVSLRFVRVFGPQTAGNITRHLTCFAEKTETKQVPMSRSRFFGVFPAAQGKWVAESYYNYSKNLILEADTEEGAARAYDAFVRQKIVSSELPKSTALNFNEDGSVTADASSLSKAVLKEREIAAARVKTLTEAKGVENDLESMDSCDEDTDLDSESDVDAAAPPRPGYRPFGRVGLNDDEEEEEDSDSVSSASGWDSDGARGEWKPKEAVEASGPMARLLKAVHEADAPPIRSDWINYILEMGMSKHVSDGQTVLIEQINIVTGDTIKLWDSVPAAARALGFPMHEIITALKSRNDNAIAGGFRWRMLKTLAEIEDVVDETNPEESWKQKLYKTSREYRSGGNLRDYQVDGLNWLLKCWYNKRSSILADEMGLGKTVQVITFLEHLFREENIKGPFLVCVPLSTIEHWRRETEGWTLMTVCIYHDIGGGRDMRDVIREFEWYYKGRSRRLLKFHVLITTYDDLIKDYEELAEVPWRVVVVDEAHRLRNTNSKLLECMRTTVQKGLTLYGYQHRILMTGTPLQNNTAELWSLLNFIEPAKFPDAEKFAERFGLIQTQEQVEALQRRISPHILRRVKEDVAKDIPPKEETIIDVELTTMQKQYYRAIFEHNHGFLSQGFKGGNMPKLMNIQMELRKCCNHPFLINGVEEKEMESLDISLQNESIAERKKGGYFDAHAYKKKRIEDFLISTSGKMVLIDKLLPKLKSEGHKVLIFSQMVKMIDLIEEFCEFRRYSCERLDGRVSGNDRQKSIDRFNKDADSFVFLLSTRAGGVGINLTAADTVIIFDSDWNPQNDVQAMARCHRIGQLKSVTIYRLITRKSFESEMFDRASKKLGLEQAVLGSRMFDAEEYEESQKNNAKMDAKELEQLLREGAYAVLMEDNDEEMKTFSEQDIESILDQRTHVIREEKANPEQVNKQKYRARKSIFTGESATQFAEVDVNDPDFWKKVLPDLVTPDTMLQRLTDPDFEIDDDEEEEDFLSRQVTVKKYINDLSKMMEGILDLQRRSQLPERERAICMKLLLQITLKEDVFDYHQRTAAQEWLTVLEGTRNRRRVDVDKYIPLPIAIETKKAKKGAKSARVGTRKARRRIGSDEDEDDDDDDAEIDEEDDFSDSKKNKRGGGGGKKKTKKEREESQAARDRMRKPRSDIGVPRKREGPPKPPQPPKRKYTRRVSFPEEGAEANEGGSDKEASPKKKKKKTNYSAATLSLKRRLLESAGGRKKGRDDDDDEDDDDSEDGQVPSTISAPAATTMSSTEPLEFDEDFDDDEGDE